MRGLSIVALVFALSACSSLVHEREQYIRFETPHATEAHCAIEDYRAYHWNVYSTPDTIRIEKGYPPLYITCKKEGFHTTRLEVGQRYDPKIIGDFVADKVGYVVPAWQNSAKQYPDTITVWMRPLTFESLEAMEEWERGLWHFLRGEEARLVATDKTLIGYASRMYAHMEEAWKRFDPPLRRVKRVKPLFDYVEQPAWQKELQKDAVWMASPEQDELLDGKKQWQKKTTIEKPVLVEEPIENQAKDNETDQSNKGSVSLAVEPNKETREETSQDIEGQGESESVEPGNSTTESDVPISIMPEVSE